jgi:hypothetical protein
MHEAKFRWALESIRDGRDGNPRVLAAEVLASADALDAEAEHRIHHVFPHPHGGTFPYMRPICQCTHFDGPREGE